MDVEDKKSDGGVPPTDGTGNSSESPERVQDSQNGITDFAPGDKDNPRNWPEWRKWVIVLALVPVDFNVSWGASGFSPAESEFIKDFGVSQEVGTLGLSLFVLGLALGPMSLAPLSEYFGRTPIYLVSYFVYFLFLMGTALAPNLGGFLPMRFLAGFFSAVTIANYGGCVSAQAYSLRPD